jgi:predicted ATPase/class 3 adenylate cyclase
VRDQPAGTLTFVFTDVEGSTRRWQQFPEAMRRALERHDRALSECVSRHGGTVFKHTGDGVCAVFGSPSAATLAAVDIQQVMAAGDWGEVGGLRVRIGLHTGEASARDGDYFGPALNQVARLMGAAHGGQILVSSTTAALLEHDAAPGIGLRDLGPHLLRDIDRPEQLYQVTAEGVEADFPPLRTGTASTPGLPPQRSSFVGREGEIDRIVGLLATDPVVTLVGIGGTGKTRLALEVAHRVTDRYGAVVFADLSPLADGQQIAAAVAAACGVGGAGAGGGPLLDTIVASLARRPTLLVLDNCEHLIEDSAGLVEELLAQCAQLVVLATSREALAVDGERIWPVGSLSPEEARDLFVDRASAADPGFRLTPDNAAAVAEICARLDGIPLAIELAAARIGHLSPAELAARLDDRFRLLTGGRRRRTQRQHTLRAAIDWSYELLSADEAALFARLSVFSGGFTLAAAEAVAADDTGGSPAVLDLLASLVSKSLVIATRSDSGTRYRMLETIRMYAADRLVESGETESRRRAHCDYFLGLLEAQPIDRRATTDVPVVTAELDNLRAAIDWAEAHDRADQALALATGMGVLWTTVELQEEGAARLTALLDHEHLDDALRAAALAMLANIDMARAEFRDMARSARRSLALDPESPWAPMAYAYSALYLVYNPARHEEAHQLLAEGRRVAAMHDVPLLADLASAVEAHFWVVEGDLERPVQLAVTKTPSRSFADVNTGTAAVVALIITGDLATALDVADRLLLPGGEVWRAPMRACVLAEMGSTGEAEDALRRVTADFLDRPFPLIIGDYLIACAALALKAEDAARAVELLETVISERGQASFRSPSAFVLWGHYYEQARGRLDDATYDAARARASGLSPAEALRREAERLGAGAG